MIKHDALGDSLAGTNGVAQVVEFLPSKYEALNWNSSTNNKKSKINLRPNTKTYYISLILESNVDASIISDSSELRVQDLFISRFYHLLYKAFKVLIKGKRKDCTDWISGAELEVTSLLLLTLHWVGLNHFSNIHY
jgi:hypothetical protein